MYSWIRPFLPISHFISLAFTFSFTTPHLRGWLSSAHELYHLMGLPWETVSWTPLTMWVTCFIIAIRRSPPNFDFFSKFSRPQSSVKFTPVIYFPIIWSHGKYPPYLLLCQCPFKEFMIASELDLWDGSPEETRQSYWALDHSLDPQLNSASILSVCNMHHIIWTMNEDQFKSSKCIHINHSLFK